MDFDTARERPCDLLRTDKAAELGWSLPGRETSVGGGKYCSWHGEDASAQAGAVPSFDLSRWRSMFGATDITISGRPALRSTNIAQSANIFIDLGEGQGVWASVNAADEDEPSDATVAAAEALAVVVLGNMSVA